MTTSHMGLSTSTGIINKCKLCCQYSQITEGSKLNFFAEVIASLLFLCDTLVIPEQNNHVYITSQPLHNLNAIIPYACDLVLHTLIGCYGGLAFCQNLHDVGLAQESDHPLIVC